MAKNYEEEKNNLNIIGSGTLIKGDIESNGDVRIDGAINGNMVTKGKVVIGQLGKSDGEIKCKNAEISGKIEGKITVEDLLTLKSTAKIYGNIYTSKLAIEPGAVFTGSCNMGESKEGDTVRLVQNPDDKQEKK